MEQYVLDNLKMSALGAGFTSATAMLEQFAHDIADDEQSGGEGRRLALEWLRHASVSSGA